MALIREWMKDIKEMSELDRKVFSNAINELLEWDLFAQEYEGLREIKHMLENSE